MMPARAATKETRADTGLRRQRRTVPGMTQHLHFPRQLPQAWQQLPAGTRLHKARPVPVPAPRRGTPARLAAFVFAWACAVAWLAPPPALAAEPLPPGGAEAVARLRAAAAQPGGEALADLAQLPFLYEGRSLDRAGFVAQVVPGLFTPRLRACLAQARPLVEDGRITLWCKPYGLVLAPQRGGWRLAEFYADGEAS